VLLGGLDGARSLAALAATRPERAGGLIAVWGTACGATVEAPVVGEMVVRSFADASWPGAPVQIWAPAWAADPVRRDRPARYFRTSATPRQAERLLRLSLTSDISDVLPLVQAPTPALRPEAATRSPPRPCAGSQS
jgi:hypothetical protein